MTKFSDMAARYNDAIKGSKVYIDAIMSTDVELIDVNQENLQSGLNALGVKITPKYKSEAYALRKERMNAQPGFGTPDLKLTGSFYERIEFHINGRQVVWEDTDSKAKDLLAKYGAILGVSENNVLQKYRQQYLFPAIAREIKVKTGMR